MCTFDGQLGVAKKLISDHLRGGEKTVQGIMEHLHANALMSQNHGRVQEIFFHIMSEMMSHGQITANTASLSDTTRISLVI